MNNDAYEHNLQLDRMPAIPEPLYGRLKWWHFRTHFMCCVCKKGFSYNSGGPIHSWINYINHYRLTHVVRVDGKI